MQAATELPGFGKATVCVVSKTPRAATLAYARQGYDACAVAGTLARIPDEG